MFLCARFRINLISHRIAPNLGTYSHRIIYIMQFFKEDSVLVVVDMQERLLPHMLNNETLEKNVQTLVEGAKILGVPTLFTQQYSKGLGETVDSIKNIPQSFEHIEKKSFSCYKNLEFESTLERLGCKNIIVCGIEAHVCVLQTAVDLIENGYHPVVVRDCVSSRKDFDLQTAFDRMAREGVMFTSYEAILMELLGTADDPVFRDISKLIK